MMPMPCKYCGSSINVFRVCVMCGANVCINCSVLVSWSHIDGDYKRHHFVNIPLCKAHMPKELWEVVHG